MYYKELQFSDDKVITVLFDDKALKFNMDFVDNGVKSIYFTKPFDSLSELFTSLRECLENDNIACIDSFTVKGSFKKRCFFESKEQIDDFYKACVVESWKLLEVVC